MDAKKVGLVKPDYASDRERERQLQHIATGGVTQLFNAVVERQSYLEQTVGQLVGQPRKERKRIIGELKEYDFGEELSRAGTKKGRRMMEDMEEEMKPKKEEPDDEEDEEGEEGGSEEEEDRTTDEDEEEEDESGDETTTDIEIKEEPAEKEEDGEEGDSD